MRSKSLRKNPKMIGDTVFDISCILIYGKIMKKVSKIFVMSLAVGVLCAPGTLFAQSNSKPVSGPSMFDKKQGGMGKFKRLRFGAGSTKCGEYIAGKRWKKGKNTKRGGSFFVAVADAKIAIKPGDPGFIDSRYVAFREAMMNAKGQMVKHLETSIASQAMSNIVKAPNSVVKNKPEVTNSNKSNPSDANGLSEAYNKALRLLNIKLDENLKKEGYDPQAKEARERAKAAAAAKKILQSKGFSEILSAVAKNKLKGVYAKYAFENIPSDVSGSICVAAYYSSNTEILADAMAARDYSQVPRTSLRKARIDSQIPSDATDEGVKDLISSFGISIHIDENGQFNIVSYGQAEISDVKNDIDYEVAKGRAELIAQASIRRFVNESVSLREKAATSQSITDLKNNMRSVKLNTGYFKKLEEVSKAFPINGMYTLREWGAQHPLTGQGIAGAVVVWNASLAEGALVDKQRLNQIPEDTGGRNQSSNGNRNQRKLQSTDRHSNGTGKSYQGGKKESEDF
jgi:hypothetical protein